MAFVRKGEVTLMLKVAETRCRNSESERVLSERDASVPTNDGRKTRRKSITRDGYEVLTRLADDGCPLVMDLEDYQVIENEIQTGG